MSLRISRQARKKSQKAMTWRADADDLMVYNVSPAGVPPGDGSFVGAPAAIVPLRL